MRTAGSRRPSRRSSPARSSKSPKPEPERPGFFVPWATAVKVGLAGTGLAAALVLMIAGYGWPLSMPEFARTSSGVTDPEYTGSLAPSWQETAARAQGLLSRESLEVGLESQGNLDLVAVQLGQAIGPGLKLPNLDAHGYRFVRAQLLRAGEEPLAQLLYLGTSGAPLALYAKKSAGVEAPAFKRYGGIGSVAWSEDGISYLLAGEADEPALMQLAETIRSEPRHDATSEGAKSGEAAPPYSPLPRPLTASGAQAVSRFYCAMPRRRRIVAGEIAVEVAPDRRRPLLVAITGIVLDRRQHGLRV